MRITPNKQKRQKVSSLLGAFAYLGNVILQTHTRPKFDKYL